MHSGTDWFINSAAVNTLPLCRCPHSLNGWSWVSCKPCLHCDTARRLILKKKKKSSLINLFLVSSIFLHIIAIFFFALVVISASNQREQHCEEEELFPLCVFNSHAHRVSRECDELCGGLSSQRGSPPPGVEPTHRRALTATRWCLCHAAAPAPHPTSAAALRRAPGLYRPVFLPWLVFLH